MADDLMRARVALRDVEEVWVETPGFAVPDPIESAFDAYVARHRVALVRYATLLAGSPAQGEDLVQDVLIRLYPMWGELEDPHPYVRRSITNEFLSWKRRWSTRHVQVVPDAVLDHPIEQSWEAGPDPELWARLSQLPRQQRAAVVLRYWEGLSDDEIGGVLDCKAATVRGHVSRGLATLRSAMLAERGPDTGRSSGTEAS